MPIKGITDKGTLRARWPKLGTLRKGAARGKGPGQELAYFRFVSDRPEVVAAFQEAYGNPDTLYVFLPYATIEENFATWREQWSAGGLIHRCDGETMVTWLDESKRYRHDPVPCPYASGAKPRTAEDPGCVPIGRLSVILPGLVQRGFPGVVTLITGSIYDMIAIQGALEATLEASSDPSRGLRGIEFVLRRVPEEVSVVIEGKRVRRRKYMVKLEPTADWLAAQLARAKALALAGGQAVVEPLAADATECPEAEEEEELAEEYEPLGEAEEEEFAGAYEQDEAEEAGGGPAQDEEGPGPLSLAEISALKSRAMQLKMSTLELRQALGVTNLTEYRGTLKEAMAAVERFAAKRDAAAEDQPAQRSFLNGYARRA